MTSETQIFLSHQILIVSCNSVLPDDANYAVKTYTFSKNVDDAKRRIAQGRYECVIACVDPSKKDSIIQLQHLQDEAKENDIPLVTTSQFNPSWIENLMAQFGVVAHFKSFPNVTQIADFAAAADRVDSRK